MLPAQVSYWQLMETKRHNEESEKLGYQTLDETKRHNLATEGYQSGQLALGKAELEIKGRQADVAQGELAVHQAAQAENARHNLQSEFIGIVGAHAQQVQAAAAQQNAATNEFNAWTSRWHYANVEVPQVDINQQQADTAQMNANTNRFNAVNSFGYNQDVSNYRSQEIAIKQGELQVDQSRAQSYQNEVNFGIAKGIIQVGGEALPALTVPGKIAQSVK